MAMFLLLRKIQYYPRFKTNKTSNILTKSLKKDFVWSISASLKKENDNDAFPGLGSRTNYIKLVIDYPTRQYVQECLPVVPSH